MKKLIIAALMIFLLSQAAPLFANGNPGVFLPIPDNPDGMYLGVYYPETELREDFLTGNVGTGKGEGIRLGITQKIMASEFSFFKSRHDAESNLKDTLTGMTVDIKLSLPVFPVVVPYGFFGLGYYVLDTDQGVYRGHWYDGYQVGGGLDFYVSKSFSFNVGYTKRRMLFNYMVKGSSSVRMQAITNDFGLCIHFH